MKIKHIFFPALLVALALSSCSQKEVADPPVLSEEWETVYDINSDGLSTGWYENFPDNSQKSSSWDDWLINDSRYRWHRQEFSMGKQDSSAAYLLDFETVTAENLLWINGSFLDKLEAREHCAVNITDYLLENETNDLVIRSERVSGKFGIHGINIIKAPLDTLVSCSQPDYNAMPKYNNPDPDADDMIIYEVFLRNYSPRGDFTGLQNKVWRLKQMGINMVWLMPIHPIGKENKKGSLGCPYSVQNYFSTNPEYGSFSKFDSMKIVLHRNDIDIMLDAVCNHSAWDNQWVKDYPDFYTRDKNGKIISPAGTNWSDVADLNYDNPQLRQKMISYFDFWMDKGIDAFRCDVSEMVPMDFWRELRDHFNEKNKNPFMLAEGTQADNILFGFDAVYGWDTYYAFTKIHDGTLDPMKLGSVLVNESERYPEGSKVMHFAENHDTPRAVKTLGTDQHHLALFTIFTAPGIPMIYSGQELNDTTRMSLFETTRVNWYRVHWSTFNLISELSKLRQSSTVLTRGNISELGDLKSNMAGYARRYKNTTWLILMNYGDRPINYKCRAKTTVFSDGKSGIVQRNLVNIVPGGYCIVK